MVTYKRILLVDDQGLTREGASLLLRSVNPNLEVTQATSPEEAKEQVMTSTPDLIFLDLRFDDDPTAGRRFLKWIKETEDYDHIPVIVMSGEPLDRTGVEALLGEGAAGFMAKTAKTGAGIFQAALLSIEAGAVYIHGARPAGSEDATTPVRRSAESLGLRPSHMRVLARHVKGMPYKRIAQQCNINEQTVKEYVGEMCKLFKQQNSKALIYEIGRAGIALDDA